MSDLNMDNSAVFEMVQAASASILASVTAPNAANDLDIDISINCAEQAITGICNHFDITPEELANRLRARQRAYNAVKGMQGDGDASRSERSEDRA